MMGYLGMTVTGLEVRCFETWMCRGWNVVRRHRLRKQFTGTMIRRARRTIERGQKGKEKEEEEEEEARTQVDVESFFLVPGLILRHGDIGSER